MGIGGAGMSALARLLFARGVEVYGSDDAESPVIGDLRDLGVGVWTGVRPQRIQADRGWVVRSAAVPEDHPEVRACVERGLEPLLYSEALGRLTADADTIAIAGTHGKTSTSAMASVVLRRGGVDASHIIGGEVDQLGGGGNAGESPWLVVEACEFDRSFHRLSPRAAAMLNFDHDHFDCYPEPQDMLQAYAEFGARVRPGGLVLVPGAAPGEVTSMLAGDVTVGRVGADDSCDVYPRELEQERGCFSFTPVVFGEELPRVTLSVPGRFQVDNALFALALAVWAGADAAGACVGASEFTGVRRRFEVKVGAGGGEVVSDYAHHPEEIAAVIATARQVFPGQRLLATFQPHQHQRTRALLPEFADALSEADHCFIADIYGARESGEVTRSVCASDLVAAVRDRGGDCDAAGALREVPERVVSAFRRGDVILMLGAGDIDQVVNDVLERV